MSLSINLLVDSLIIKNKWLGAVTSACLDVLLILLHISVDLNR